MKILIVEDDFGSRRFLQMLLQPHARCDVVVDGGEAIEAFSMAWEENDPYQLILLDIMMPNVDGQTALKEIRGNEAKIGVDSSDAVKVIMTTALEDPKNVVEAYYQGGADSYLVKPIDRAKLFQMISDLGLPLE
ncbi:MAG: response regulator [Spirochaeta sp.]|nr:response regulator [Spirochaeta sp.]